MTAKSTIENAPALDIDWRTGTAFARGALERRIVWNLIRHLERRGFHVYATFDGDEFRYPKSAKGAMEICFNLNEVSLLFVKNGGKTKNWRGVWLVFGKGEDVISDWNNEDGDADGFHAAMDAFKVEDYL